MSKQLKIIVNISKGSLLTGNAWVDVLLGGERVVERAEITETYNSDPNQVNANKIEINHDYDGTSVLTLTVINSPETIGPIQIYAVDFILDNQPVYLNWQTAIKGKPIRFGGQPNVTITNPHIGNPELAGWCSVPDVSPGMSITWGLQDLVNVNSPI